MSKQLDGRTIFLSGAGGVLGSTYISRMLQQGAKIVATDLPGQRADALKDAHGDNPAFAYYDLDMANEGEIVDIFQRIAADGNTIAPGAVFNGHSDEFQRRVSELIMAGRMAQPDEIADVMLFLCSPQAGYMTGQLVNVDGGFSGW